MDISSKCVTVIVPVYNAQNTIQKTVESILKQKLLELQMEILLIDDGSTDHSFALCDQMAKEHAQIRAIHTTNHGVSAARNRGIAEAKGEYIVFVDADDTIQMDMIWKLYCALEEKGAQSSCCGYIGANEKGEVKQQYTPQIAELKGQEDIRKGLLEIELTSSTIVGACWAKMFLTRMIRDYRISFPEETSFGEDFCFCADYYSRCENICFVNEPLYYYYMQEGSLVHRYHEKSTDMYTYLYRKKISFYGEEQDQIRGVNTLYLERMLGCFENTVLADKSRKETLRLMQLLLDNQTLQNVVANNNYEINSRYLALLLRLYKKQRLHTIYLLSKLKVVLKSIRKES